MKCYWLFGGINGLAQGGFYDFISAFKTQEEAIAATKTKLKFEWWHIVCVGNGGGRIVATDLNNE